MKISTVENRIRMYQVLSNKMEKRKKRARISYAKKNSLNKEAKVSKRLIKTVKESRAAVIRSLYYISRPCNNQAKRNNPLAKLNLINLHWKIHRHNPKSM